MRLHLRDGSRTKRRIGDLEDFTREQAQEKLEEALKRLNAPVSQDPTFSVAAQEYLDYCEDRLRQTTMRTYRGIVRYFDATYGAFTLSDLAERSEQYYHFDDLDNQHRVVLAGIYEFARRVRKYSGPDPTKNLQRKRKIPPAPIEVYSPDEIIRLAEAAHNYQDSVLFVCAGFSGLRLSELRGLCWRDVDFLKSSIHVRRGYTDENCFAPPKSGRERSVPMIPQLSSVLQQLWLRDHHTGLEDLVFCDDFGGVLSSSLLYRRFQAAAKRAGLRRLRFHDLRHSCITMMVQIFPLSDVQVYAGHANIQTTMKYVHFLPHTDAAEKLGRLVSGENH
jgi:integrase